jgi:hypothetical protein
MGREVGYAKNPKGQQEPIHGDQVQLTNSRVLREAKSMKPGVGAIFGRILQRQSSWPGGKLIVNRVALGKVP